MIETAEILRAADLLMKQYGTEAPLIAARRSDDLRDAGDAEGSEFWWRILEAVAEVWRTTPANGEHVN
jgi:hypothetical protein